ncbi:hypothetical protein HPTD01_3466 [Halomonas sp. TD01]|nr:hypothetical protein HPTD01_3466 [Halomonas sp. TD01]
MPPTGGIRKEKLRRHLILRELRTQGMGFPADKHANFR